MTTAAASVRVLAPDQAQRLADQCCDLLTDRGVLVRHKKALAALSAAGADADLAVGMVRFPPDVIRDALRLVPSTARVQGVEIGHGQPHPLSEVGAGPTDVIDDRTGEARRALLSDLPPLIALQDRLPGIDIVSSPYPSDVAPEHSDLFAAKALLEISSKPCILLPLELQSVGYLGELLSIAGGGEADLRKRPRAIFINSLLSPFEFKAIDIEVMLLAGRLGQPLQVATCAAAGTSAPVTVAGHAVVSATEVLAGIIIAQLLTPGMSVIANVVTGRTDMASGDFLGAVPSNLIATVMADEIIRTLCEAPVAALGLTTDHGACDGANYVEKAADGLLMMLAETDILTDAGCISTTMCCSAPQLMADSAIVQTLRAYCRPVSLADADLAMDQIVSVPPGGNYLSLPHTRKHCRRYMSESALAATSVFGTHRSTEELQRDRETFAELTSTHDEPKVDPPTSAAMQEVLDHAIAHL